MPPIPFLNDVEISGDLKVVGGTGNLDLSKNEIQNAAVQNLASEPGSPVAGQIIHNTAKTDSVKGAGKLGYRTASAWVYPDMEKSVYDANNDGKIDLAADSEKLNNQAASYYLNRTNHTGTQTSSTISDFAEAAQDAVGTILTDSTSVDFTYNDASNTITAVSKVVSGGGIEIAATGLQLTNTGVSANTYTKVTVDVKGRITSATNLTAGDLPSHTHTSSDITDFHTAVRTNRLDQMASPTTAVSFNSQKITNLADPTNPQDAATKNYVDNAIAGTSWKNSVTLATTANIALTGSISIDGTSTTTGMRVLVKNQTTAAQNGVYVAAAGAWSRASDCDSWAELISSAVFVEKGTVNADSAWVCTVDAGGTLGTTAITYTQFSGAAQIIAGDGLTKTGNQLDVQVDNQSIEIVSDTVQAKLKSNGGLAKSGSGLEVGVDNTTLEISGNQLRIKDGYNSQKKTFQVTGNSSATDFTITHNLGTKDILIAVYEDATGYTAYPNVERTTTNTAKIYFKVAPATGIKYNIVVIG